MHLVITLVLSEIVSIMIQMLLNTLWSASALLYPLLFFPCNCTTETKLQDMQTVSLSVSHSAAVGCCLPGHG